MRNDCMDKFKKDIVDRVKLLSPDTDDVITFYIDMNKIDYENANSLFEILSKKFPNNKIIALPSIVNVEAHDRRYIKEWIENAKKQMEEN